MTTDLSADVAAIARIDAVPKILEVVCRTTGVGFAAVARVTDERWIACAVRDQIEFGLKPGGELAVETTICSEIRDSGHAIVFDDAAADSRWCGHPTPAKYGFRSYISMPIFRADGSFFGTLCAIDPRPVRLNTPETVDMFKLFAELIAMHLDDQARLAESEAALVDAAQTAKLREEFIAVLGHDLRNPLASISASANVLRHVTVDPNGRTVIDIIEKSVRRMAGLIDNLMDFARARMGSGIQIEPTADERLAPVLEHVVAELRAAWPKRRIDADIALPEPVYCDRDRIGQLLSNLLANALAHGAADGAVAVAARVRDGVFELSTANSGEPIPPEKMQRLFQPFTRSDDGAGGSGLGLGLYIAWQIAQAHGGTLGVTSTSQETRFTLRMPARASA